MSTYRPNKLFRVPFALMTPTYTRSKGVDVKTFIEPEDGWPTIFASFATYGGTDKVVDGVTVAVDTGIIECWYNAGLTQNCRLKNLNSGQVYEVLGQIENIEGRNQFMKFRVEAVRGGA